MGVSFLRGVTTRISNSCVRISENFSLLMRAVGGCIRPFGAGSVTSLFYRAQTWYVRPSYEAPVEDSNLSTRPKTSQNAKKCTGKQQKRTAIMGRKKRLVGSQAATDISTTATYAAPITASFDAYGRPLPPPLPPPPPQLDEADIGGGGGAPTSKRSRTDGGEGVGDTESYLVKKYRPDSYYRSIEAFARYTKAPRLLDASYVRWTTGGETPEKPIV